MHRGLLGCSLAVLAGCERTGPLSVLDPAGPSATAIATVTIWMLAVAGVVTAGVIVLWLAAMRRGDATQPEPPRRTAAVDERNGRRWMVAGGVVLPAAAIAALLVFGTSAGHRQLPWPIAAGAAVPLRIDAIGHQWRWELRYPGTGVRLENEMRMPAGRAVDVHTASADVIHSFWVPRLGGKLDAIPGHTRVVRLLAEQPGIYRGVCAEFCGIDHAHMTLTVVAMAPAEFDAWLAAQKSPAAGAPAQAKEQQQEKEKEKDQER